MGKTPISILLCLKPGTQLLDSFYYRLGGTSITLFTDAQNDPELGSYHAQLLVDRKILQKVLEALVNDPVVVSFRIAS